MKNTLKLILKVFLIMACASAIFIAGAAFKQPKVYFVEKNKCEDGFCLSYEKAFVIEDDLESIQYYANKIESGDTTYNWHKRIGKSIEHAKKALNDN